MNLVENKMVWGECQYPGDGDCWAAAWGGTDAQWNMTILPRIERLAGDTKIVVEIGCGMGRHIGHLYDATRGVGNPDAWSLYLGLDVVEKCIKACRAKNWGIHESCMMFDCNDGKSIPLEDGKVDFVFSWDSLVHADREVMAAYLGEIARVLGVGGRAFIHHSNLEACSDATDYPRHARDPDVSAAWVREKAEDVGGLRVVSQECVAWGGDVIIDCFTVLERSDDHPYPPPRLAENVDFMEEARVARRIADLYK